MSASANGSQAHALTDFNYLAVYGSGIGDPGSTILIGYAAAPTLDVQASPHVWYYVPTMDFSGNESGAATAWCPKARSTP